MEAPEPVRTPELSPQRPRVVPPRRSFWQRNRWLLWLGAAAAVFLVALSVGLAIAARRIEPYLRARIVDGLQQRFHTRVELDSFHVSVRHGDQARFGIWATGRGLRIWPPQKKGGDHPLETSVESLPLIDLEEFSFHVPLRRYDKNAPVRIAQVRLKGLTIRVPPGSERDRTTGLESAMSAQAPQAEQERGGASAPSSSGMLPNVVVEQVLCDKAELVLETNKPDKLPLTFAISRLKLVHLAAGEATQFEAQLTNAKPVGLVDTSGSFGPWDMDDPGRSQVSGRYRFAHADLSDFNGIAGMLSSNGTYNGTLRNLVVDGETMVPDFRLTHFGAKLPLHTRFHARVDGTDGDTYLDRVDATLGRSQFTTAAKIVRVEPPAQGSGGKKPAAGKPLQAVAEDATAAGHLIDLKVDVPQGQMEDFLRLVSKTGTPLMTGTVETRATLHIPPGGSPVDLRMKLDGYFRLNNAQFTSEKMQERVEDLSLRGQGKPDAVKNATPQSVASEMRGNFHVANGVITLPGLQYSVPGALIELHGTYALEGSLHFDGNARMQATVSQMVGGWKGFLLKPVDRFFKKDGAGALVPIKVRGTREEPDFGIDLGRLNSSHPERPGESAAPPH